MHEPLVSIIVPVYNVQHFLMKCLDSLVSITYSEKEIILVDDCSTDGSGKICDEYKVDHPNICVIHQPQNKGVTEARIAGLEHAQGEYVMFVDSDDYVHPDILSEMVARVKVHNADMVCCQLNIDYKGSIGTDRRSVIGVFDKRQIEELLYDRLLMDEGIGRAGMPLYLWGKLYKRSLVDGSLQKGQGMIFGEDEVAVVDMLVKKVNKLACLEMPLYYYVQHEGQVTAKTVVDLWAEYIKVWEREESIGEITWDRVLPRRMWCFIKPSIYIKPFSINPLKFIRAMKGLRKAPIVKKHLFGSSPIPEFIRKHPHYFFLKYRLYWMDYLMYMLIWFKPKN